MSVFQELFGGPMSGLLSKEQIAGAEKQALRDFSLSMLANAGSRSPGGTPPSFVEALAMGTIAGRESYDKYSQEVRSVEAAQDIDQLLSQGLNVDSISAAYTRAVRAGDLDTARTLGPLLQDLIGPGGVSNLIPKEDPQTGYINWHDGPTGQIVLRGTGDKDILAPGLRDEKNRIVNNFNQQVAASRDVANSYRRVLSSTTTLVAYEKAKKEAEANGTEPPPTPTAAAMAAISSFARLLDPGSVVRSEEFKVVSNQGSALDKLKAWYKSIMEGTLPENLAQQLQDEAYRQTKIQRGTFDVGIQQAQADATSVGIDHKFLPIISPFDDALEGLRTNALDFFDPEAWLEQQARDSAAPKTPEQQAARQAYIDSLAKGGGN